MCTIVEGGATLKHCSRMGNVSLTGLYVGVKRERQYPFCFAVCVLCMKCGIVVVVQARIWDWSSSLVDFGSILFILEFGALYLDFVDAVVTLISGFGGEFGVIHGGLCFYSQGHRFRKCHESLKCDNVGRAEKTETCEARAGGKSSLTEGSSDEEGLGNGGEEGCSKQEDNAELLHLKSEFAKSWAFAVLADGRW